MSTPGITLDENYFDLDWRTFPTAAQVLNKLETFLILIDQNANIPIESTGNRTRLSCQIEDVEGPNAPFPQWTRKRHPVIKPFRNNEAYFAKIYVMISYLTQTIGNRQSVQFRQVYYTAVEHLSRNQTKNLVEEIALNCNLHPTSLGIEAEADGLLWHGEHLQLKLCRIDNVFITAKQKAESQFRKKFKIYRPGISGHPVPSQLLDLSVDSAVQGSGTRARAVIVVEHENIGIAMQAMKDTFKDVIVLMTQGYPSIATRELLHLLYIKLRDGTPFLYYTDYDPHGMHIYTILKKGCRSTAPFSSTLVCPVLQWVGPTPEQVIPFRNELIKKEAVASINHLPKTCNVAQRVKKINDLAEIRMANESKKIEKKMGKAASDTEISLIRGMRASGALDGEAALEEAANAVMKDGKLHLRRYRLGFLSTIKTAGIEAFIVETINQMTGVTAPSTFSHADIRS